MSLVSQLSVVCFVILGTIWQAAAAAPEEIQVYLDDMSDPGQFGVDLHNNDVLSGANAPSYPGEQPPDHVYRFTPEFYYGLSKQVELGLYLLTTTPASGDAHYDGAKLRLKYVADHDPDEGLFYGANLEVGRTDIRVSPIAWAAELKGILGLRTGRWTLAVNPNLDSYLGKGSGAITLDVDLKVAYDVGDKTQVGVEAYNELGPVAHLQALERGYKAIFLALDKNFERFDLNLAIGRGLTSETDRWILKFIVGTHF
jgi:hypothetical protein